MLLKLFQTKANKVSNPIPNNNSNQLKVRQEFQYTGPIPPPAMLEQYNKIVPGAAERILRMAEDQSSHRRTLEKKAIDTDSRNSILGIMSALVITMSSFGLAAYAIKMGQSDAGKFIGGASFLSLVGAFIYGTRSRRIERESKLKQ